MGEARRRQWADKDLLIGGAPCIYCGQLAETVDHCPPKVFFVARAWPQGYVYPACESCNGGFRYDDQALALLVRVKSDQEYSSESLKEFGKLVKGIANNNPSLIAEWELGAAGRKRAMRKLFGSELGDQLRNEGWGAMNLGASTIAMIQRFMVRLGQSLYFHHVRRIFEGTVFTRHVSLFQADDAEAYLTAALSIAPLVSATTRGGKSLSNQFSYRYNFSPDHGIFYAVVHFSHQFVFQITALQQEMADRFIHEKSHLPVEAMGVPTRIAPGTSTPRP